MELTIGEARKQFAAAIKAAQRGERVVITENGEPVAEIGPPAAVPKKRKIDWDVVEQYRRDMGWDKLKPEDLWPPEFDDPAFSRKVLGIGDDWDPNAR